MEPQKDRLEEYFRKKLESLDDMPSPGGWDVPSDNVWKGIETGITKNEPSRRNGFFKYALLALLLPLLALLIWQWYSTREQVNHLTEQVNEYTAAIEDIRQSMEAKENQNKANAATPEESKETLTEKKSGESSDEQFSKIQDPGHQKELSSWKNAERNNVSSERTRPAVQGNYKESVTNVENAGDKKNVRQSAIPLKDETFPKDILSADVQNNQQLAETAVHQMENVLTPATKEAAQVQVFSKTSLDKLATRWPVLAKKSAVLQLPDPLLLTPIFPYQTPYPEWSLNPYFSPTYSYRSLHHKMSNVSTPFEKTESPKLSYTAGVLVGHDLSKRWRIYSGLNYQRFNQSSRHTVGLRYKTDGANVEPGGNAVNTYQTGLQTSFGEAIVEVRIANDAQSNVPDVNEGRVFPVRFQTELELQHLGIPLLAEYRIGNERLALALKGGVVGSYLLDKGMKITDVRSLNNRLVHRRTDIASDKFLQRMKDFTLDLQLSAGVQVGLSKRLALTIEPTFRGNLTPVFENERLETRMFSLAIHTGVIMRF